MSTFGPTQSTIIVRDSYAIASAALPKPKNLSSGISLSAYIRMCLFGKDAAPRKVRARIPIKIKCLATDTPIGAMLVRPILVSASGSRHSDFCVCLQGRPPTPLLACHSAKACIRTSRTRVCRTT